MKFSGLQKTSLIDYPDKVASVLFTPGCNLRCPFCHNWRIVIDHKPPFLQDSDALDILERRKKYIDAVVITGGEPCMHKELPQFLAKLKDKGFQTKLDTNGFFPEMIKKCLLFLDYIATDIKTSPDKYPKLGNMEISKLIKTIDILKKSKVNYEFRITVVPRLITKEDLTVIGQLLRGSKKLVLQQFVPNDTLDKEYENLKPYSLDKIEKFAEIMRKYVKNTSVRL